MSKGFCYFIVLSIIVYPGIALSFESHCENKEQVIFNCRLEKSQKVVSICKIGTEGPAQQHIQYVFGKIGKAELTFPKENKIAKDNFSFYSQYSNSVGYLEYDIDFAIGRNSYNIYWMEVSKLDGVPKENVDLSSGVSVATGRGKVIDLKCSNDVSQNFMSAITTSVSNIKWADKY